MALDPGSTPRSAINQNERDRARDTKATEERIVKAVVEKLVAELNAREKVFYQPMLAILTQMGETQNALVEKVNRVLAAISEQSQQKHPSLVDFQLGGGLKEETSPVVSLGSQINPGTRNSPPMKDKESYGLMDLSHDLDYFKFANKFHNFEFVMTTSGQTDLQVKDGELTPLQVKQMLYTYISVNALHTQPRINSWNLDKTVFEIIKNEVRFQIKQFKDFLDLMMIDVDIPEPQKPMTLLDLFAANKRKDLDNTGTHFNSFTVSFNKKQSQFIITKNSNVVIRAIDVIRCFNTSIEAREVSEDFHHPVLLETHDGVASTFIPLFSMKQLAEWLLVK